MINKTLLTIVLIVLLIILAGWYFSNILLYVIISLVLATILRPLTNNIARARIPRFVAILISFAVVAVFVSLFVLLFIPLISDQITVLSSINYDNLLLNISRPISTFEDFLINNGLTDERKGFILRGFQENVLGFLRGIDFSAIINEVISLTGSFFIGFLAVVFITFFLLYENGILRRQIINMIPNQYFEVFIGAIFKIERLLSNYLLGLLFQMFSIFSIAAIGLSLFGIRYALTIALFAAIANLIPYLGPILGGAFGIIVGVSTSGTSLISDGMIILVLKVVSVFAVVQMTDNLVLQPLIFSKSVKAHPLEIFVIIFAGATIAGIPGMIAAIPAYTIVRVSTVEIYEGFTRYQIFKSN